MTVWKVYLITNKTNGKGYVGITSKAVRLRLSEHVRDAFPGRKNPNGTLYALHAALQKYGQNSFSIDELEVDLTLAQARSRERFYIEKHGTYGGGRGRRGYNQTLGGEVPDEAYRLHHGARAAPANVNEYSKVQNQPIHPAQDPKEIHESSGIGYLIALMCVGLMFVIFLSQ